MTISKKRSHILCVLKMSCYHLMVK